MKCETRKFEVLRSKDLKIVVQDKGYSRGRDSGE